MSPSPLILQIQLIRKTEGSPEALHDDFQDGLENSLGKSKTASEAIDEKNIRQKLNKSSRDKHKKEIIKKYHIKTKFCRSTILSNTYILLQDLIHFSSESYLLSS